MTWISSSSQAMCFSGAHTDCKARVFCIVELHMQLSTDFRNDYTLNLAPSPSQPPSVAANATYTAMASRT